MQSIKTLQKSQQQWQWSRMPRRRKVRTSLIRTRRSALGNYKQKKMVAVTPDHLMEESSNSRVEIDEGLSHKYQPKAFQDMVGHQVIFKAISKAVERNKVARLYLFYGSPGNGKTSAARIFAMSLQCQSATPNKPCWTCRGCSRGTGGFQTTSKLVAAPGFKVFIIEECHSLTANAWEQLLIMMQSARNSIFILITTGDITTIPKTISSRCQKFCFQKLEDIDVSLKLARIVAAENIEIEGEALQLIVAKAEGSLREAEIILDQLTSLAPTITTSMVQHIVGLVPRNKLINLLTKALSGDTKGTIISTTQLFATGVEAQAIVSQLISLITDILSTSLVLTPSDGHNCGSQLKNNQSERLCYALQTLVEQMEKKPRPSISHTTLIFVALLQIASRSSPGIVLPRDIMLSSGEKSNAESEHTSSWINHHISNTTSNLEDIWLNMLEKIQSIHMKDFLCHKVKLASLTISSANAIVHLMFKRAEDKLEAQNSEDSIANALKNAIGWPVTINMSLEPVDLEIIQDKCLIAECGQQERTPFAPEFVYNKNLEATMQHSTRKQSSSNNLKLIKLKDSTSISKEQQEAKTWPRQNHILSMAEGLLSGATAVSKSKSCSARFPIVRTERTKHRCLSLSSIQQSDASVEPYSQDILFEKENIEKESRARKNLKLQNGSFKAYEDEYYHSQDTARSIGLYRSWTCKEMRCQTKPKVRNVRYNH